jgi:hypothetical protein
MQMPMCPFTDQEWEELPHVILTRDTQWNPSTHDNESGEDHIAHLTKVVNDMAHTTQAERRFDDQGRYQHRTVCAIRNTITIQQLNRHATPTQDINNLMRRMDLSNIPLDGISDGKTQNSSPSNANDASNINKDQIKNGPEGNQDPLEQFYEERKFNKETMQNSIATQDSHEAKAMADIDRASLPEHTARTVSYAEPDYEGMQPTFGWMKASRIKMTFQATTQYGRLPAGEHLYKLWCA